MKLFIRRRMGEDRNEPATVTQEVAPAGHADAPGPVTVARPGRSRSRKKSGKKKTARV